MLPDLMRNDLMLAICGTAAGNRSMACELYYSDLRNRFWDVLYDVRLTPRRLFPRDCRELLNYGIGLLDLVTDKSGQDKGLSKGDYKVPEARRKVDRA